MNTPKEILCFERNFEWPWFDLLSVHVLTAVICILCLGPIVSYTHAQVEPPVDELIEGFDDMETGSPPSQEDDLLDGFDDDTPQPDADDDLLEGFEDDDRTRETAEDEIAVLPKEDVSASLGGHVKAAASYNFAHEEPDPGKTDWRGWSRLKTELLLELDVKLQDGWRAFASGKGFYDFVYGLKGSDEYTDEVLDSYEGELEVREAYLQGGITGNLDIKLGRQIVVWGKSDNIRVVDVLNPLDLREPGLTDIEDLRLPVTMTKLDYYWGDFNLSGIAIHEVRFNENPAYGSDFYPLVTPLPPEDVPSNYLENTQFAVALNGIFTGWDLGFYWADIYDPNAHLEVLAPGWPPSLELKHARINMLGSAVNVALGNWLLKAEAAWLDGLKFTTQPDKTYTRLDVLGGVEYSGFTDTTIALEIADQHIFDHEEELEEEPDTRHEDQIQWAARLNRDFMNETLSVTLLLSVYGEKWQNGAFQRLSAEYDITDALLVNGGVVFYQSGDLLIWKEVEENDRLFLEFKYSF
jgi:hypothetical protein